MTRFERDLVEIRNGDECSVLSRRKSEIERLTKEGKACKNKFRMRCIAQEVARLKREYEVLDSYF